jgi:hypothetical protein
MITAKPIVENKFWIIEDDGQRVGTLHLQENEKYMLSSKQGEKHFNKKHELITLFGKNFFVPGTVINVATPPPLEVHGYPTAFIPYNPVYNIQQKLPLFSKSEQSKSLYCAGYYAIKFGKGWVKSFCPKLITVERYEYRGPFKTELELKQVMTNVTAN